MMAGWYEPRSRFWHSSQLVGESVIVRGGCIPGIENKKGRKEMMKKIDEFDIKARTWRELKTKGDRHPGLSAVASASAGKYLYAYGGLDGNVLNGVLSQLDLETLVWTQLSPKTSAGPLRKDASGMVHFGGGSLAVVCGYAYPVKPKYPHGGSSDHGSKFIARNGIPDDGSGWTNEMHIFDLRSRAWLCPIFTGPRPPPCADFALTSIDNYRALLYGGRRGEDHQSRDIFLIDFGNMVITKIQPTGKRDPWPRIRLGQQAACCFGFNTKCAQLLISGGRIRQELPLSDMWLFDLMSLTWKEVKIPDNIRGKISRWGHTATTITHSEGLEEVLMFGGCSRMYEVVWEVKKDKDYLSISSSLSFIFGFIGEEWKLLDVVDSTMEWNTATFDLESEFSLGALYSMEQEGIPILSELMHQSCSFSSMVYATQLDQQSELYKWPTLQVPSLHKPTWKKLCSILHFIDKENLADAVKRYLKKKNDPGGISTSADVKGKENTNREIEELKNQVASLTTNDSSLDLRGVEVCGETLLTITNAAQKFKWEGYGLTVHIPEKSLPQDTEQTSLKIAASIAGQYEFPANSHLVSAIYWFRCERRCKFEKQLTVEIHHCAKSENASKLSFVRAVCSQEQLPYTFKPLEGGQFTSHSSYGILKLNRFSGIASVQEGSEEKEYYASLFYLRKDPSINREIHYAVTMNTDVHLTVVKKEYEKKNAQLGLEHVVEFESERISLNIPMEGTGDLNGWKIIPLMRPVIIKEFVDRFKPGKGIPHCQLLARVVDPSKREPLQYTVNLEGAKEPYDVFTIHIEEEHTVRDRSASDPAIEVSPASKRRREQTQKSYSCESKMTTIKEDETKDANTPTLKLLTILKWKNAEGAIKKFKTKLQLATKWREIGTMLEIPYAQLELWSKEKQAMECCEAVLEHWLSHPTEDYPATWEGLYELLDDCEFGVIISNLKEAVENAV